MRRITFLLVLLVSVVGSTIWPSHPAAARAYTRWAYYVPDDPRSYRSLQASYRYLDIVAPDAWRLYPDGSIRSRVQPEVVAQMRRWGLKVVPMISKYAWSDRMHGFLASPAARSRAAAAINALVNEGGYDGIHIDFENIATGDGPALEAFVAEIAAHLRPDGKLVTMALPARTATRNSFPDFNYARLAAQLDLVVIMAYDHGYAGGRPSPVAPIGWVNEVAAYSASQIPRGKILLGVSWYGYDWNTSSGRPGRYVGFSDVAGIPGERGYDTETQAPWLRYIAGGQVHRVWYENAQSVSAKFKVVVNRDLQGWAAWRLGYDDPAIWSLIGARR